MNDRLRIARSSNELDVSGAVIVDVHDGANIPLAQVMFRKVPFQNYRFELFERQRDLLGYAVIRRGAASPERMIQIVTRRKTRPDGQVSRPSPL